jgi:hypothetical protein
MKTSHVLFTVFLVIVTAMWIVSFFQRRSEAQSAACGEYLATISVSACQWACDHDGRLPLDFLSLSNQYGSAALLASQPGHPGFSAQDWASFATNNTPYEILAGGLAVTNRFVPYLRCRIHGHLGFVDGVVFDGTRRIGKPLVTGHAPRTIDLNPPVRVTGHLGYSLGTRLTLEGSSAPSLFTTNLVIVSRINGKPLKSPITIGIRGNIRVERNRHYRIEGYESGEFLGCPSWRANNARESSFHFQPVFIVTRDLETAGGTLSGSTNVVRQLSTSRQARQSGPVSLRYQP